MGLLYHLEYIEIHFFIQYNNNANTLSSFQQKCGLKPVRYTDFNKTVLFYIENTDSFSEFSRLLELFYNASENEDPTDKDYHIITLIQSFEFLSSEKIKKSITTGHLLMSLTDQLSGVEQWEKIKKVLFTYLEEKSIFITAISEGVFEMMNAEEYIDEITDNFDIIQKIQSIPPIRVTPGAFGTPRFSWGFRTVPNANLPIVAVIDTGVDRTEPLEPLMKGEVSILDRPMGIGCDHGTQVASLIAFGKKIIDTTDQKEANANLYSIQLLYREEGAPSYKKLKDEIIYAHKEYGIRIFNLSVCGLSLEYNAPISEYAIMLDELAYTYDLLIFIATGNLEYDYIENVAELNNTGQDLTSYPKHFYNITDRDLSQPTNLGSPAESMNNISVGAIAYNNRNDITDLTHSHTLPAYYTRKFHLDYAERINGSDFFKGQMNKNIFKPDILMAGGDWHAEESKMIVLGRGQTPNDYYIHLSGTSLATPLAANIAAQIINKYPGLSMQSVKALLINSSETTKIDVLLEGIILQCKEKEAQSQFGRSFNNLGRKDKMSISRKYNPARLAKYIEGYGVPDEEKCLNSTNKRVTIIVEDTINSKHYKVQHIKLPDYLLNASKKNVLKITGTLCFKFSPIKDDQISYNPVHISFNILNAQSDIQTSVEVLANEKKGGIPYIDSDERKKLLAIKTSMESWSEDFWYVNRQIFSNTQQKSVNINKGDLQKVNNEIAVAIRCVGKSNYIDERVDIPYSLVLNIEEEVNLNLEGHDLYEEISAINHVESIVQLDSDIELEMNN